MNGYRCREVVLVLLKVTFTLDGNNVLTSGLIRHEQ